jgi:hypothetical protein
MSTIPDFPRAVPYIHTIRLFTSGPRRLRDVVADLLHAGVAKGDAWTDPVRDKDGGGLIGHHVWCQRSPEAAFPVLEYWQDKLHAVVSRWDLAVDWPGSIIERRIRHDWLRLHTLMKHRRRFNGRSKALWSRGRIVEVREAARSQMLDWVNESDFDEQYDQHGDGLGPVYWIAERARKEAGVGSAAKQLVLYSDKRESNHLELRQEQANDFARRKYHADLMIRDLLKINPQEYFKRSIKLVEFDPDDHYERVKRILDKQAADDLFKVPSERDYRYLGSWINELLGISAQRLHDQFPKLKKQVIPISVLNMPDRLVFPFGGV